jgi:nitroreductase
MTDLFRERRCVREYLDKPIEQENLDRIMEAANWAPTAGNCQEIEFIIVRERDLKDKLYDYCREQEQLKEADVVIVICANLDKIRRYGRRGEELYSKIDTGITVQNIALKAWELGVGSCYIGSFDDEAVTQLLDLPANVMPMMIMTLGYPDEKPESHRENISEKLFKERYGST